MKLPWFRVRTMMIVAIAALAPLAVCAYVMIYSRRSYFYERSAFHGSKAKSIILETSLRGHDRAMARWHLDLAIKYQHAAENPWLPVEPDPPKPK